MPVTRKDLINDVFKQGLTPSSADFSSFCEAWINAHFQEYDESSRKICSSNFVKLTKKRWSSKAKYHKDRLLSETYFDAPLMSLPKPPPPPVADIDTGDKGRITLFLRQIYFHPNYGSALRYQYQI